MIFGYQLLPNMILRILSFLVTATVTVTFGDLRLLEALKGYDRGVQDKHFSPLSKLEVSPEEVLSYQRSLSIFPSKGIAVTNHIISLSVPMQLFLNVSDQLDELHKIDPSNIHVKEAIRKKDQTKNLLSSVCNYDGKLEKRFILGTIIVSFIAAVAASSVTTVGVYSILGHNDRTTLVADELGLKQKKYDKQKSVDAFLFRRIKELRKTTDTLAYRMEVNDAAAIISMDYENLMRYLESIINVQNYDFAPSKYLANIEGTLSNNTAFSRLMKGNRQFGLDGATTLLSLSETTSLLMSEDEKHLCEKSSIISKWQTIIPDEEYEARATSEKYKFKLDQERSIYINPASVLERSQFRPLATFTKMRRIVGLDTVVQNLIPFNNTYLYIKTSGGFEIQKSCNNVTKMIKTYKNPFLKVPEHCTITSKFLNVSKFEVFYSLNEIDPLEEIHDIEAVDFSPLYDHNDAADLEDYQMEKKIDEIWNIGKRITTIEKELLENQTDRERIEEGFSNLLGGIKNFFVGLIHTIIIDPFYQVLAPILIILFLLCLGLRLHKRKKRKAKKKKTVQVESRSDSDQ